MKFNFFVLWFFALSSCSFYKSELAEDLKKQWIPWVFDYRIDWDGSKESVLLARKLDTLYRDQIDTITFEGFGNVKPLNTTIEWQKNKLRSEMGCPCQYNAEDVVKFTLLQQRAELGKLDDCTIVTSVYLAMFVLPISDSILVGNDIYIFNDQRKRNVFSVISGDSTFVIEIQ